MSFLPISTSYFDAPNGAGEESRTLDLNLGKVALYQLSYSRMSFAATTSYDFHSIGGAREDRTPDLLHAMQTLSQLSYGPIELGGGEEDRTPDLRIANATLSQLSYTPKKSSSVYLACLLDSFQFSRPTMQETRTVCPGFLDSW